MAGGRPRGFDVEQALTAALGVFLAKGYDGASLADLTQAMGINPPSLYAAFGNKEGLFLQVLERYEAEREAVLLRAMNAPTAAETVELFLRESVEHQTLHDRVHGCLLVQGALACADQATVVRKELSRARLSGQPGLAERFQRAQAVGEISAEVDPDAIARYVCVVVHGLAVQAASGVSREQLFAVIDVTMRTWPGVVGSHRRRAAAPASA